jgi:hypothetical protein
MGERNLMRKRITLLIAALMLALTMAFSGAAFANPNCTQVPSAPFLKRGINKVKGYR